MGSDFTIAQFNSVASGEYNAGQIDIKKGLDGSAELVKVNNHVVNRFKNNVVLSPERVLEVKESFLNALQNGGVSKEKLSEIRNRLGMPAEIDMRDCKERNGLDNILKARYTPLTRKEVRSILDTYVTADAPKVAVRSEDAKAGNGGMYGLTDAISLLSADRPITDLARAQGNRFKGAKGEAARKEMSEVLNRSIENLFAQALKMLPAGVRESGEFRLFGMDVKLVKDDRGDLSAVLGNGATSTTVRLDMPADVFIARLIGRAAQDSAAIGPQTMTALLEKVYDHDLETGLLLGDRTSLTRHFASIILEGKAKDATILVKGNYNTGILVEMAENALANQDVGDTRAKLDAYHNQLLKDNAQLPDDIKAMLEKVADIPLEKPKTDGELIVREPIVAPLVDVAGPVPPKTAPVPASLSEIGGTDAVKDFIADFVFSDETMVSDVVVNRPGETMRKMLSDDRKLLILSEIIKDASIIDKAVSPKIANVVKNGFGSIAELLNEAFMAANDGEKLSDAAKRPDFLERFKAFFKDASKLPGKTLAQFDNKILLMASNGCQELQKIINEVFKVDVAAANDAGTVTSDPYKSMSPEDIKADLSKKNLNQILDSACTSDAPGQVGFFRQVVSGYFTQLRKADQRSCFAAAMRYAGTFDFGDMQGEALEAANKSATGKFVGAILKGTSPLLQKMMQGLPREIVGDYADVLADMKSSLAPIPRKIVQAHLMKMIADSKGKGDGKEIESIELVKSLGAASVGEAFLCKFKLKGDILPQELVVKIMRHDAEQRVNSEATIFAAAAKKIGQGMEKTWEGQFRQYKEEFDFRREAANVDAGHTMYGVYRRGRRPSTHPLAAIAPNVGCMKMSGIVAPQKNVMVAEVASGKPVDKFFKEKIDEIREVTSGVFKHDPATGRIVWENNKPVLKDDIAPMSIIGVHDSLAAIHGDLTNASRFIMQATKAWMKEAILGSGQFHGDAHSGNLMVDSAHVTFIDFGNLYSLDANRADGVNERAELLRVILGATFRDKKFVLDGFKNLMSQEGRTTLEANRDKAEAILDAVLDKSKGEFAFNIIYRLQAAVVELQKLGLELPPQINCFIQSMVRLSNTVTEMNTIVNQCKVLLDATVNMNRPAKERDELDIIGKCFDEFASSKHKARVPEDPSNPQSREIYGYRQLLPVVRNDGVALYHAPMFKPDGEYTAKVVERLESAADPLAEAQKLVDIFVSHGGDENNERFDRLLNMPGSGILVVHARFKEALAAANTPEERSAAIRDFAKVYAENVSSFLRMMDAGYMHMERPFLSSPPNSFTSAITYVLLSNMGALVDLLKENVSFMDKLTLGSDAATIATDELGLPSWQKLNPNKVMESIQNRAESINDAAGSGGDNGYKINIGV